MRESTIQKQIIQWLQKCGAKVYNEHGDGYTRRGKPDIIACVQGRFVAVECKAPGENPTPLQLRELDQIRRAGGVAFVAHSLEEAQAAIHDQFGGCVINV